MGSGPDGAINAAPCMEIILNTIWGEMAQLEAGVPYNARHCVSVYWEISTLR